MIKTLPRHPGYPVLGHDEQQRALLDSVLEDAAAWHESRTWACSACKGHTTGGCIRCGHDDEQMRRYVRFANYRDRLPDHAADLAPTCGQQRFIMGALAKARAYRQARDGADDRALAAAYGELARALGEGER